MTTLSPVWCSDAQGGDPADAPADAIRARLEFRVPPSEVQRFSSEAQAGKLRNGIATMLQVDDKKVKLTDISASRAADAEQRSLVGAGVAAALRGLLSRARGDLAGAEEAVAGEVDSLKEQLREDWGNATAAWLRPAAGGGGGPLERATARRLGEDAADETGVLLARYLFTSDSPEERRRVGAAIREPGPEAAQRFLKVVDSADPGYLRSTVLESEDASAVPLPVLGSATIGGLDQRWLIAGAVALAVLLCGCCAVGKVLRGSSKAAAGDGKKKATSSKRGISSLPEDGEKASRTGSQQNKDRPESGRAPDGVGFDPRFFDQMRRYASNLDAQELGSAYSGYQPDHSELRPMLASSRRYEPPRAHPSFHQASGAHPHHHLSSAGYLRLPTSGSVPSMHR